MGLRSVKIFYFFSLGMDFKLQNLPSNNHDNIIFAVLRSVHLLRIKGQNVLFVINYTIFSFKEFYSNYDEQCIKQG